MSNEVKIEEPTFDDVLEAIKQLDSRISRIESLFEKHEHKVSGEVILRLG